MARCLVDIIEANGGKVLTRASVSRILVEHSKDTMTTSSSYRVTGVLVNGDVEIPADLIVSSAGLIVSSAGYHNTFGKLLPEEVVSGVGMPQCVPGVGDSAGFVMCNVGIRGNSQELDIPNCNLWVQKQRRKTQIHTTSAQFYEARGICNNLIVTITIITHYKSQQRPV